jgi:hypothetical protein
VSINAQFYTLEILNNIYLRGWLHGDFLAWAGISARLLTDWKKENNLNNKSSYFNHTLCFLFKLFYSFPYVNSRDEISARAEISPCKQPLKITFEIGNYFWNFNVSLIYLSNILFGAHTSVKGFLCKHTTDLHNPFESKHATNRNLIRVIQLVSHFLKTTITTILATVC